MNFTHEHEMFRSLVRRFVEDEIEPHVDDWEDMESIPRSLFERMGELGLLGIEYPKRYGGADADVWMTIVLAEELARCRSGGVAFGIIVHTDMSSPWLARLGSDDQKRKYIPSITSGRKICALAITEPGTGSDMASIETRADRRGADWVINGAKTFITNGVSGDLYFVAARTQDATPKHRGLSQFLVERSTPGLTVSRKLRKTGMWASETAELVFEDVRVPSENLLGEEGRGFYQLAEGLQRERLLSAVLSVSAARQALDDTIEYLQGRPAFGRPLSEFQAIRHRIADMAARVEAARRLTYSAAEAFAQGEDCVASVSMAKLFSTETANSVAYEAVQMHGGMGYMRELPIERFARDYRLWTIAAGSSEIMREIIAKRLFE